MTQDEIAMCLGLQEPSHFTLEMIREHTSPDYVAKYGVEQALSQIFQRRRTGRTTWMLCEALAHVSCFKSVYINAGSKWYAEHLRLEAKRMATKLELDAELIVKFEHEAEVTVDDHTVTFSNKSPRVGTK